MTIRQLIEDLTAAAKVAGLDAPAKITTNHLQDGEICAVKSCASFALIEVEIDPPDNPGAA